jgi:transposase
MDVHQETMAVASGAHEHGAAVTYLGTMGTRPCDIAHLVRTMPAKAPQLVFVDEAGPWGSWRYRYRSQQGDDCWGVAPSLMPKKAGDRVKTDRRDAVPLARLARSGDLPTVDVPTVEDDAMRDLRRAREDPISDRQAAKFRLNACWLRHAIRSMGRATWNPAQLRWRSAVVGPTPAQPIVFQA